MSLSQFILYGNWIIEGGFKEKWLRLKSNKLVWIFVSIYFLHLLWLWPPQDYNYALNDLRVKLLVAVAMNLSQDQNLLRKVIKINF
jgi:hypothetical protein